MRNEYEWKDLLYMHLQASERFVVSSGMNFQDFAFALGNSLPNLLLLKHQYEEGEFNRQTQLNYVPEEQVPYLLKEDVSEYGDFCWIDFEGESTLENLEPKEMSELLYLGHFKVPLCLPFYQKLNNQYVYLAHDDGWLNKVYYRSLENYFQIMTTLLPFKLESMRADRNWLGLKKKRDFTEVPYEVLLKLVPLITEGAAFSLSKTVKTRTKIEIPVWILGDFLDMDEMRDAYDEMKENESPHALLIFQRKTKEWSVIVRN